MPAPVTVWFTTDAPPHRTARDFPSWELIRAYRLAYQLSQLGPSPALARELSIFLLQATRELQHRDDWRPDYLRATS